MDIRNRTVTFGKKSLKDRPAVRYSLPTANEMAEVHRINPSPGQQGSAEDQLRWYGKHLLYRGAVALRSSSNIEPPFPAQGTLDERVAWLGELPESWAARLGRRMSEDLDSSEEEE